MEVCPAQQAHAQETVLGLPQVYVHHDVLVMGRHLQVQLDVVHCEVHAVPLQGLGVPGT